MALVGVALGIGAAVCSALYFARDPMEYDLRNDSQRAAQPDVGRRLSTVNKVTGRLNQDGTAVMVDRVDQVLPLVAELERRRDTPRPATNPSIRWPASSRCCPTIRERKIELIARDRSIASSAAGNAASSPTIAGTRSGSTSPTDLRAITMQDLPELVARPFQERNGDLGKVVYVSPRQGPQPERSATT